MALERLKADCILNEGCIHSCVSLDSLWRWWCSGGRFAGLRKASGCHWLMDPRAYSWTLSINGVILYTDTLMGQLKDHHVLEMKGLVSAYLRIYFLDPSSCRCCSTARWIWDFDGIAEEPAHVLQCVLEFIMVFTTQIQWNILHITKPQWVIDRPQWVNDIGPRGWAWHFNGTASELSPIHDIK